MTALTDAPAPLSPDEVRQLLAQVGPRPAPEGARVVMRGWLDTLRDAAARWEPRHAVEALHDVRVAVRRLRTVGKAHAALLGDAYPRPVRRALRRVARDTGALRDLQVQQGWLLAQQEQWAPAVRPEAEALASALAHEATAQQERAVRAMAKGWPALAGWEEALAAFPVRLWVGRATIGAPYAWAVADALERGRKALTRGLDALAAPPEGEALLALEHGVRVALKRQRALMAHVAPHHPAVAAWHALATRGQELLGAMRDAAVLGARARPEAPGVAAVLDHVVLAHRDAFVLGWVQRRAAVLAALDAAAHALRTSTPPVTPAGLPVELERKLLLHALPPEAEAAPWVDIAQGWLPGTALRERLRRTTHPDGTVQRTRTIKLGPATARLEVEEEAPAALFDALWPLTAAARVTKRRHTVAADGGRWEVDVFTDRPLVLAEIEQHGDAAPPPPPAWLIPYIVRDVTLEPEFTNAALARPAEPTPPPC
jgi:CHAD domain-containing protein/CYTH domain-containing protein